MRLTAAILIAALAAPSYAADGHVMSNLATSFAPLPRDAYSLGGGHYMGAVIPDDNGPYDDDDEVKFVGDGGWKPGLGQNLVVEHNGHLIAGAHTRDRGSFFARFGDAIRAALIGKDPADQKGTARNPNPSPGVKIVWRDKANGIRFVQKIKAKTTAQGNGRIVRRGVTAEQFGLEQFDNLVAKVVSGPGKARGRGVDRGDAGFGDGSSWSAFAEGSCVTPQRPTFNGPSISDIRSASQSTQRGSRGENNRDEPGRNQPGERRGRN